MIEALKKKTFKSSLLCSIVFIIAGIFLSVYFLSDAISVFSGYQVFEELEPDEIKTQQVEIDVTANFGCYMEEYSENTSTHRRTTTDLYYVIWTGNQNSTDFKYMTIKVPARYESEMEKIAENTYNEMYSEPLHFVGKIRKLSKEELGYFEEFFTQSGWSASDIEDMTLPYYIDVTGTSVNGTGYGMYVIMVGAGIALLIAGICRIIKGAKGGYLKKFRKAYEEAGYTEAAIDSDLASAASFDKKGSVKIGRLCTYYNLCSTGPRAIPNNKIMWAYQTTTTHRTNGIKTGVTYSVMVYVEGNKGAEVIGVPNEATAQEVLKKMGTMLPWIVIGYSEDLKKLFNKDRTQFLQLRYNAVEHIAVEPGFENNSGSGNAS